MLMYAGVAIFAPYLTPYNPMSQPRLAQAIAMPEWITVFPQFQEYGRTQRNTLNWQIVAGSDYITNWGTTVDIQYAADNPELVQVALKSHFAYEQLAPNEFYTKFRYEVTNLTDVEYSMTLVLTPPDANGSWVFFKSPTLSAARSQDVTADSKDPLFIKLLGYDLQTNVGNIIFAQRGNYTFTMYLNLRALSGNAEAHILFKEAQIVLLGRVHGILGTDYLAKDIWSHIVWGSRISLIVGLLAAIVGTAIGIFVGVVSGYLGGMTDEVLMRTVDILLCLPLLPLLLALVHLYGRNVYYIVLFIAIFGWQGLARVIRSQTLSIRETPYIESARASGGSGFYIMRRHIVPNIIPVAFASMILAVPGAILFEAALSFLGFGDPRVVTWGMMLQHAFGFGGFSQLAWWWILPPGLAIIGLCLSFVFVGHAFDEIVNPRLRRRR